MNNLDGKDWELYCRIARSEPFKEHTELLEAPQAAVDPHYITYKYGDPVPDAARGCTLITHRNADGELMITKTRERTHELVVASSGAGKTQGCILSEALNMDGKTSYIFTDPKGEVTERAYAYAVEKYGKDNVIIANYMEPRYSNVKFNPLTKLARQWMAAENESPSVKRSIRDNIVTEISKFLEVTCVIKAERDPTWEETARNFIFAIIMGLFEDLTISPQVARLTGRTKTTPEQINFGTVSKIFGSFSWERNMEDHGFLSSRPHDSIAYQNSKAVIHNAANTRANYMQFVENYLRPFSEPKIRDMSSDDTFDIESMATTPKVLFIIYDLSDVNVREWVNTVVANSLQSLLAYSHKMAKPFEVPVVFVCDEFPTLKPHGIYPTILETGRGSNLFMIISVQSLSQIQSRYASDYISILGNCGVRIFLGTNDIATARNFIDNMGQMTVPDASAFLAGKYASATTNVVTVDRLMHRMRSGESYICIDRNMPIHGNYELYYYTPEYMEYPIVPNNSHSEFDTACAAPEYDLDKLIRHSGDADDDDFFESASPRTERRETKREREDEQTSDPDDGIMDITPQSLFSADDSDPVTYYIAAEAKSHPILPHEALLIARFCGTDAFEMLSDLASPPCIIASGLSVERAVKTVREMERHGITGCMMSTRGEHIDVELPSDSEKAAYPPAYTSDDVIAAAVLYKPDASREEVAATIKVCCLKLDDSSSVADVFIYRRAITALSAMSALAFFQKRAAVLKAHRDDD